MAENMRKMYMDYAASTPMDKRVFAAMEPFFTKNFGNPSSLHQFGQEASRAVFGARSVIADSLEVDYKEIVFTGSASEGNNLALRGTLRAWVQGTGYRVQGMENKKPKIIISSIEHESILETARDLEREGVEVVYLPVSREGIVDLNKLKEALDERTVLVSVMYANNEIGTIQPISKISEIIRNFRSSKFKVQSSKQNDNKDHSSTTYNLQPTTYPLFHTDAAQAFQYLNCKPDDLGVDLMTLSAHKIYGPKGIGMLYIKKTKKQKNKKTGAQEDSISPIITGAGQEMGMRAGTENVPYIVGFAEAIKLADKLRAEEGERVGKLRDELWDGVRDLGKETIELNGSLEHRLPNNLNFYFPGHKAHELLIALDVRGIAASSGSACNSRTTEPSATILALGYSKERAISSLRFSLGRETSAANINKLVTELESIVHSS